MIENEEEKNVEKLDEEVDETKPKKNGWKNKCWKVNLLTLNLFTVLSLVDLESTTASSSDKNQTDENIAIKEEPPTSTQKLPTVWIQIV